MTPYLPVDFRALTSQIIAKEGPVFDDIVIRRVARAHGFARTGGRIREAVLVAVEARFPRTQEGERAVLWPDGCVPTKLILFRHSQDGDRGLGEVPLVELAGLAQRYLNQGADEEEVVRHMAADFGLGKLREGARGRFLAAIAWARS